MTTRDVFDKSCSHMGWVLTVFFLNIDITAVLFSFFVVSLKSNRTRFFQVFQNLFKMAWSLQSNVENLSIIKMYPTQELN